MGRFERDVRLNDRTPHGCSGRTRAIALALAALGVLTAAAPASPPPPAAQSPHPAVTAALSTQAVAAATKFPGGQALIGFLSQTIGWYRHLAVEARMLSEPAEALYVADDRQMAGEVLALSFEYARAEAKLLARLSPEDAKPAPAVHSQEPAAPASPQVLTQKAAQAETDLNHLQQKLGFLQKQLETATGKARRSLLSQLAAAQSELDRAQARAEAFRSIIEFKTGAGQPAQGANALRAQIDQLQKSVPEAGGGPRPVSAAAELAPRHAASPDGIIGLGESLLALDRKLTVLRQTIDLTSALAESAAQLRAPFAKEFTDINRRSDELARAAASTTDAAALRQRKKDFQALIERQKLLAAAAVPLAKQAVVLGLYSANLERWRGTVEQRWTGNFRSLVARLIAFGLMLAAIFGTAALWRHFTFRYVQDAYRRHQLLQARRIVLAAVVALVLLFNFANELGAIATVMGLAAAGLALALQNVILSVAGYFFLIGKFGIKAGDRVQIAGVTGDVIDIGLVKLSLMEVSGGETGRQPTGRVVVFSNAVVFQPSGNFFKQIPGASFAWNEVSFTLAPDCDYGLAEKRLMEAVDEVVTQHQEGVQRQYRRMEKTLNLAVEAPHPQSRLRLDESGIRVVIRYPAEIHRAAQIADAVSRRLLDTIRREPTLKLVSRTAPNIQAAAPPDDAAALGKA